MIRTHLFLLVILAVLLVSNGRSLVRPSSIRRRSGSRGRGTGTGGHNKPPHHRDGDGNDGNGGSGNGGNGGNDRHGNNDNDDDDLVTEGVGGPGGHTGGGGGGGGSDNGNERDNDNDNGTEQDECFPADAIVTMTSNRVSPISALKVGDVVQTASGEPSVIFAFSHQDHDVLATFRKLTTSHGNLSVTQGHFVFVNGRLRAAKHVRMGDALTTADGEEAIVRQIEIVKKRGLFNPHPHAGELIVDGFRVSAFTTALPPTSAHSLLTPLRMLFRIFQVDLLSSFLSESSIVKLSRPLRHALI